MSKQKYHKGIDATQVFEKLCNHVAKNFFGTNSKSLIFGTAISGSFVDKVKNLLKNIGEGGVFIDTCNAATKNDDGIDIVVWKDFSDKKIGKLIGFGQCKTGTSWRDDIHRLNPTKFIKCWFSGSVILTPIPIIFICDTLIEDMNFFHSQEGRLFFNRFRLVEYIEKDFMEKEIIDEISLWLEGALTELTIN